MIYNLKFVQASQIHVYGILRKFLGERMLQMVAKLQAIEYNFDIVSSGIFKSCG